MPVRFMENIFIFRKIQGIAFISIISKQELGQSLLGLVVQGLPMELVQVPRLIYPGQWLSSGMCST